MYHFDLYTSRAFTISKEMRKQTISNRRRVMTNRNAGMSPLLDIGPVRNLIV